MKFDLHINQKAIIDNGFDLDLVDAAIIDYCLKFSRVQTIQILVDEDITYYWFQHENVCEQLPILRMKRDTMYRRMKVLCEKSFLKAHPQNKQKNQSWYALCPNAYLIESTIGKKSDGENSDPEPSDFFPMGTDGNPMGAPETNRTIGSKSEPSDENPKVGQNQGQPSDQNPKAIGLESEGPSDENPMYKYIKDKSISNTSLHKDDDDVENARATADLTYQNLDAEKPPTNPHSAAPLSSPETPPPQKKIYGDGQLQLDVRRYYRNNPGKYPTEMVPPFLDWYTEIMQNSTRNRESDIGKERWRTYDTWTLAKKLDNWHTNFLNDQQQSHDSAQKNAISGTNASPRATGPAAGSGKQTKRAATIKPGMFSRNGKSGGNANSSSGGSTIRIDVGSDSETT